MDPSTALELLKIGGPALLFAVVLLYATLRDKSKMADEMNQDKRDLLAAYIQVGAAVSDLREALNVRPCIRAKPIEREQVSGNGG